MQWRRQGQWQGLSASVTRNAEACYLIPSIAHFVWYGTELPYLRALAIRSAATHGGFDSVRLHHADPLDERPHVRDLYALPNVELVPLDDRALCEEASGPALADLVGALKSPVARSNLVRAALVYRDGGVYLDMDTLTIRPFDEVRSRAPGFLGEEEIVFPEQVVASRDPRVKAKAYVKTAVRDVLRRLPHGYRLFPRIARHYHRALNQAVIGSVPGHAFCAEVLTAMTQVPKSRWNRPYALGTHVVQSVYARYTGEDLHVFPSPFFYPLPPEISAHWFRSYRDGVDPMEVLDPSTCCVHWYASVRTKKIVATMDEVELRRLAGQQLFASLATRVIDGEIIHR
ncbi:MAG: glycosyl transferase [Deltaproteobacteria bacterium]|nr:glycosyl transferase [Deltaproteobacteria bacterium]